MEETFLGTNSTLLIFFIGRYFEGTAGSQFISHVINLLRFV